MTFPNWPNVLDNPQIIMLSVQGHITRKAFDDLTALVDSLPTTSEITCAKPSVTLFPFIPLTDESVIRDAVQRNYQIGCYIRDTEFDDSPSLQELLPNINETVEYLNAHIQSDKKKVNVCRSAVIEGKQYEDYLVALSILGVRADWSYRTHQAMYPFTLSFPGLLCDKTSQTVTPLCPGVLPGQWIIPNNALWTDAKTHCFTLDDCLHLVGNNATALQYFVLDNFASRMNTRQKRFHLWQARQPFTLNMDANFASTIRVPALRAILTSLATYKAHFTTNSHENVKYTLNVSQLIRWTLAPSKSAAMETTVTGYDFFRCEHHLGALERILFSVYVTAVAFYVVAAAILLSLILFSVRRTVSVVSPFGFGVVALEDNWLRLLLKWEYAFTVVASAFSPWIVGWSVSVVVSFPILRWAKASRRRRFVPGPAGFVTAATLCYMMGQLLSGGECLEKGHATLGLFIVLLVFVTPYCVLYDLLTQYFEKSVEELESCLISIGRRSEDMKEVKNSQLIQMDNVMSTYGNRRKRFARLFTNTPYAIAFAIFAYICDWILIVTVLAVAAESKSDSNAVSSLCRADWLSWRDMLFIFGYHAFLRTIGMQTVKYLKHCESWISGYEITKNSICKSLNSDDTKRDHGEHQFLSEIRQRCEGQRGLKRCLVASLSLHFVASPVLQSLLLDHLTSNWDNFSSAAAQAMYMAAFIATVLYSQIPFAVVSMFRKRVDDSVNPFLVPVSWGVLLTVLQCTVPYIASQILVLLH